MAPGARVERDLETTADPLLGRLRRPAGCATANDQGFPFAGLSISGSIVTVRENTPAAGGRGAARSWRPAGATDDAPLAFGRERRGRDQPRPRAGRRRRGGGRAARRATTTRWCRARSSPRARCGSAAGCPTAATRSASRPPTRPATRTASIAPSRSTASARCSRSCRPSGGRRIGVFADDPGAGVTGGTIEVRSRKAKQFRALRTRLRARAARRPARARSRRGPTIRASATDARRSPLVDHAAPGAPAGRLRAAPAARRRARGLSQRAAGRAARCAPTARRPAAGRRVVALQRAPGVDGARERQVGGRDHEPARRFRLRLPAGASRTVRIVAPGGARRSRPGCARLHVRVPWSSSLTAAPRAVAPGGSVRLSGRLRLHGRKLPPSGKLRRAAGVRSRALARVRLDAGARRERPLERRLPLRLARGHLPHPRAHPARGHAAVRARLRTRPALVRVG